MKRIIVLLLFVMVSAPIFAGGIVTNVNQSCAWVRMPSRGASTSIDAVYYNPAGLTKLPDGFHVQINNQTLIQNREIVNEYPYLTGGNSYKGDVFIPALPTAFFAYKKEKFALWGGFAIVGGGGAATYKAGLPSFEIPISNLVPSLAFLKDLQAVPGVTKDLTINNYSVDLSFEGKSIYYGIQAGASYAINNILSVAAGFRYVMANNTYKGHIKNITVFNNSGAIKATDFLTNNAIPSIQIAIPTLKGAAAQANTGAATLNQAITAGLLKGTDALSNPTLIAGLQQLGINPSGLTNSQAAGAFQQAATTYTGKADQLEKVALPTLQVQKSMLGDKEVDVEQTGSGYCPIIGVNLSLFESKLNIGAKYEFKVKMDVTNKTTKDDVNMFPDGEKISSDMPALLTLGVEYKILPDFSTTLTGHYYFDRDADYGKKDNLGNTGNDFFIEDNSFELALGVAYNLTPKILFSAGYLYASTSPALAYQTDLSYTLSSNSVGFGGKFKVTPEFDIDFGYFRTKYIGGSKTKTDYKLGSTTVPPVKEEYYKDNTIFSIGLTYRFGKTEAAK
jgi:long-subunit fatty acid transport protein